LRAQTFVFDILEEYGGRGSGTHARGSPHLLGQRRVARPRGRKRPRCCGVASFVVSPEAAATGIRQGAAGLQTVNSAGAERSAIGAIGVPKTTCTGVLFCTLSLTGHRASTAWSHASRVVPSASQSGIISTTMLL
jgi:hypothetical protein